jgi:hypothetical protein
MASMKEEYLVEDMYGTIMKAGDYVFVKRDSSMSEELYAEMEARHQTWVKAILTDKSATGSPVVRFSEKWAQKLAHNPKYGPGMNVLSRILILTREVE